MANMTITPKEAILLPGYYFSQLASAAAAAALFDTVTCRWVA